MSLNTYIFYSVLFIQFSGKAGSYSKSHLSPKQTENAENGTKFTQLNQRGKIYICFSVLCLNFSVQNVSIV